MKKIIMICTTLFTLTAFAQDPLDAGSTDSMPETESQLPPMGPIQQTSPEHQQQVDRTFKKKKKSDKKMKKAGKKYDKKSAKKSAKKASKKIKKHGKKKPHN